VLGFRAVGKTTLTTHFVEGRFVERYDPTIENTFQKTIRFKKVQFFTEIVDSAGMDEYSRLSRNASVGVHGYLLLYAANSRNSFSKVQAIDDLLLEMHGGSANVARVLVSTMIDLDAERTVSYEEGQALADSRNIPFIECSAKENINVTEVFTTLIREIERDNGTLDAEVRAWARVPILPPPLARSVALSPCRTCAPHCEHAFDIRSKLRTSDADSQTSRLPSSFALRFSLLAPRSVPCAVAVLVWQCLWCRGDRGDHGDRGAVVCTLLCVYTCLI